MQCLSHIACHRCIHQYKAYLYRSSINAQSKTWKRKVFQLNLTYQIKTKPNLFTTANQTTTVLYVKRVSSYSFSLQTTYKSISTDAWNTSLYKAIHRLFIHVFISRVKLKVEPFLCYPFKTTGNAEILRSLSSYNQSYRGTVKHFFYNKSTSVCINEKNIN